MSLSRRQLLGAAVVGGSLLSRKSFAQQKGIRIGVMNDESGPFRDLAGRTSLICAQQAAREFGQDKFPIDIIYGDHQNKPDVGAALARRWFDQDGVDVIMDVPTSSVAFAVSTLAREKDKMFIASGAASPDLTGSKCSPNTLQWTLDAYMLAKTVGGAIARRSPTKWYFITVDYVFGHQLEKDTTRFVTEAGGQVLGASRYPLGSTDFSSYLLKAQASGANVLGLALSGQDMMNCIKQAHEFGLNKTMQMAALSVFTTDIHGLGLETAQDLLLTETFYWNLNDRTRAFTARVRPQTPNNLPNMIHAGCYSATLHLLKAVASMDFATAKSSGRAVVERMKAMPTDDDAFGKGSIRIDGRTLFPAYLFQVKRPSESRNPWDLYKLVSTVPPDQAWRPLSEGGCEIVKS
jgi:branched-chain amino acid transport system substrate-binding protein